MQIICNYFWEKPMHQHGAGAAHLATDKRRVILVGNPNVGKSIIFSQLSGRYVAVSNYPGTTVEVSSAVGRLPGSPTIIDTPGINSLIPQSEDERITRDILLEEGERVVVQVGDAKNIRRALVISTQLAEMGIPFILDLNMWDEAQGRGIALDLRRLSQVLGVPVVETVAVRQQGLARLKEALARPAQSSFRVSYDDDIQRAAAAIAKLLPEELPIAAIAAALMLLSGDESLRRWLEGRGDGAKLAQVDAIVAQLQAHHREPLGYLISQQRQGAIEEVLRQVIRTERRPGLTLADRLGAWSMHPIAGIPILLAILYLIYKLVGEFGAGEVVDFIESVLFGEYLNPWVIALFDLIPIPIVGELFVGDYGLITMGLTYAIAIVLPIMTFFFLAFGVLEDSGYLPRLAIMVNRLFGIIGLNGRAVLPMVLGFGCDTMATLTTRILESRRERLIATLLLALGIPCSAQLGVILAMLGGVSERAFALFVVVIASQLLVVGFLASRILPGETSDFIVEIPPIRIPKLGNVLLKTFYRVEWFLKEAVPLFLLGTFILFLADKAAILGAFEEAAAPIVQSFLSLPGEATNSFIMGFLRRDYGAAGLFMLQERGLLDTTQILVSLVVITLFVPCIANLFVIIKERGLKTALVMVGFIFPFAVLVGGVLNFLLRSFEVLL